MVLSGLQRGALFQLHLSDRAPLLRRRRHHGRGVRAQRHRVRKGWLFLTGTPETMEIVRRSLGFVYNDPAEDADKSRHVGMLRIGDAQHLDTTTRV